MANLADYISSLPAVKFANLSLLNRTSTASIVPKISSSQFSKSAAAQSSGLFYITQSTKLKNGSRYKVGDLFRITKYTHKDVVEGLKAWLADQFSSDKDVLVESEVRLKSCNAKEVFTTRDVFPDVSVNSISNKTTCVQFEVVSDNNRDATIWKLALGLSLQLHHLRNGKAITDKVVGFCVPVNQRSCVEMIECNWKDADLIHEIVILPLDKNLVHKHIKDVFIQQSSVNFEKVNGASRLPLVLAPSFLQGFICSDAVQIPSNQSIVIMSVSQESVYKRPFSVGELKTLRQLSKRPATPGCAFPTSEICLGNTEYFKFKLYMQPLVTCQVRPYIAEFVEKVADIIERLHAMDIAHLDIRLENICIDNENLSPILIDFDRSAAARGRPPADMMYGTSQMYNPGEVEDWKCCNVDWRQFAMLIISVTDTTLMAYHQLTACPYHHNFIKTLFNQGEYDKDLFAEWRQTVKK